MTLKTKPQSPGWQLQPCKYFTSAETHMHTCNILQRNARTVYKIGRTKYILTLRIAAIRNENMDYTIVSHCKDRNHGSAASLKFKGIERVTPNTGGGNIINQL